MLGGFEYILLVVVVLLVFFCFLIGVDKMIKLIVGTTVLTMIVLGRSALLQTRVFFLEKSGEAVVFLGIKQETWLTVISSIDLTTSVLIFVGLMMVIMSYGQMNLSFRSSYISPQLQQLILAPAAILSILVGLGVSTVGVALFDPIELEKIAIFLTNSSQLQNIIMYLPLGLLMQSGIVFALLITRGVQVVNPHTSFSSGGDDIGI